MKVVATDLPGVLIIEPQVFRDARGLFVESYQARRYQESGVPDDFVQNNQSRSKRGVLRGLHFQVTRPQAKLVRVSHGSIFDVAVDVRQGSPTFGRWTGVMLDDESHRQLYIPPGFAHGFCTLSDYADVQYAVSDYYTPGDEQGIAWNDPQLGIHWPGENFILSDKDRTNPLLRDVPAHRFVPFA